MRRRHRGLPEGRSLEKHVSLHLHSRLCRDEKSDEEVDVGDGCVAGKQQCVCEFWKRTVLSYNVGLDGHAEFGMTVPLPGTCNYFTNQFRFDVSTPEGKNLLLTVMAAKTTGLTLLVGYTDSTAPGTNHNSGCTYSTMADVTNVGLQ